MNISIPEDCPKPLFVENDPTKNNTDDPLDKAVESNYEGGTYYFSSAQDPSQHTSVYGSSDIFALAMFQRSAPTLLAYGGTYAKNADMKIENILPFAFLFGIGGPKMERRVKVSLELCIQVYMRLSLEQFMEGPTILVMNHIYNRQMSYKTGVMTCRSTIDGIPLGEKLSTLSTEDFEQINDNNNDNLNATTKSFLKAISTTCKAMGHTEQAAKVARQNCFAMSDYHGLNSLFLSTTPDDECSFRVRL
jgi:ribosomal protein L11